MRKSGAIAAAAAAPRRPRGRPKVRSDEAQRALIAENALTLFVAKGVSQVTMDDVAAQCHISKRTLYELFASKADLFAAIVAAHRFEMLALPGDYDKLPLTEALAQIFRVDLDAEASERRMSIMRFIMVETRANPELGRVMRQAGPEKAMALLSEWLERQRRRGRIEIDDTAAAAKILMDMIFGAMAAKAGDGLEWPGEEDRASYERRCIHIFVNGVRTPKTKR